MESYDLTLKKSADINIFFLKHRTKLLDNEITIAGIEYSRLAMEIKNLPKEIQKKIFIFAMKYYWKNNILYFSKLPFFYVYNEYLNKEKKKMIIDNVHFLHLDFNTLPENKKYISGCQCDYCKDYSREEKDKLYNHINNSKAVFLETINSNEMCFGNGVSSPNDYYLYEYVSYVRDFNFNKDKYFSCLEDVEDSPLYFSSEIVDNF